LQTYTATATTKAKPERKGQKGRKLEAEAAPEGIQKAAVETEASTRSSAAPKLKIELKLKKASKMEVSTAPEAKVAHRWQDQANARF
jgi:hypothetical protein